MPRAWIALPLLLFTPSSAAAAAPQEYHWSIKVVASGTYAADYGDERLQPNQYTSAGVDGQGSGTWKWVMKAVGEGRDLDARAAVIRMSVSEQQDFVVYSVQMGQVSETELCPPVLPRNETDRNGRPNLIPGGDWVTDSSLDFYRSGRGFQINHVFDGLLTGCAVGDHGMAYYDGTAPNQTRVPRGAFNPRSDRSYSETWGQDISLGREHDVSDPNKLHTYTARAGLTITVKRISERTANRRTRNYRNSPHDHRI